MNEKIEEPTWHISSVLNFLQQRYDVNVMDDAVRKEIIYSIAKIEQELHPE